MRVHVGLCMVYTFQMINSEKLKQRISYRKFSFNVTLDKLRVVKWLYQDWNWTDVMLILSILPPSCSCQRSFISCLSSFPSSFSNNNQSSVSGGASISVPTIPVSASLPNPSGRGSSATSGGFNELRSSSGSRKARVLYDYDAASSSELSLLADEVRLTQVIVCYSLSWRKTTFSVSFSLAVYSGFYSK